MIRHLASAGNITAFGDLDQSIYGWRGAMPLQVTECFLHDFSARKMVLPLNYRATRVLIRAADSFAEQAFRKRFTRLQAAESCPNGDPVETFFPRTESEEEAEIARRIQRLIGSGCARPGDIAVLTRTNRKAQRIGSLLEEKNVPCLTVEQYQFFRRQEVKDALAFLKLLLNPNDLSAAHRLCLRFVRGVGERGIRNVAGDGNPGGVCLADLLRGSTFEYDDPFGLLLEHYRHGRIVVMDTETTGLQAGRDHVVEIAWQVLEKGRPVGQAARLLKAGVPLGDSCSVHGITEEDIEREGIVPGAAIAEFLDVTHGALVVGHNVSFDLAMVRAEARRAGIPVPDVRTEDTYRLARRFLQAESFRLGRLAENLGLEVHTEHRALGDVQTTVELLQALVSRVEEDAGQRAEVVNAYRDRMEDVAHRMDHFRREMETQRPAVLLASILEDMGVRSFYAKERERVRNLDRLVSIIEEHDPGELRPVEALARVVQFAGLAKNLDHLCRGEDKVIVAPVHQGKGLEFRVVFIAGAVDGMMPSFYAKDLEEEKRLFYVAMTRPKERLYVSGFRTYVSAYGRAYEKDPSPFLRAIDPELRAAAAGERRGANAGARTAGTCLRDGARINAWKRRYRR